MGLDIIIGMCYFWPRHISFGVVIKLQGKNQSVFLFTLLLKTIIDFV